MHELSHNDPASFPSVPEVLEVIRRIAARELDRHQVLEVHQRLVDDLALDSMELTVMAVGLENHFRIRLREADALRLETVGDLANLVRARTGEEGR
jgi:acyl carrier protein